jgi:hypothetical protein
VLKKQKRRRINQINIDEWIYNCKCSQDGITRKTND